MTNPHAAGDRNPSIQDTERLMDTRDIARLRRVTPHAVRKARHEGSKGYPPFVRIGRRVFYRVADVDAWLASLTPASSTAQADALSHGAPA